MAITTATKEKVSVVRALKIDPSATIVEDFGIRNNNVVRKSTTKNKRNNKKSNMP